MAQKTKFFRVALEGATTDGRVIERAQIEQMARNYNPTKYGARIWLEHIRGIYPDGEFRAYGDVTAVKAEEVDIDGKKKLALFAQIEPLPELVDITTKKKQKIYTSIEINPKFSDSGQAYLVGLGVTDSPASLGTEILAFAAQKPEASPFKNRKLHEGNFFTEAIEVELEFEDEDDDKPSKFSTAFAGLKSRLDKFAQRGKKADSDNAALVEVVGDLAEGLGDALEAFSETQDELKKMTKTVATLEKSNKELQEQFKKIDTTDASRFTQRPAATGGNTGQVLTDC